MQSEFMKNQFLNFLWGMETVKMIMDDICTHWFLNFLWGMETRRGMNVNIICQWRFWTSYEGWKPKERLCGVGMPIGFLNFLWGMETYSGSFSFAVITLFLNFLWGMETNGRAHILSFDNVFLNFLWGMETGRALIVRWAGACVFELPMRDGN